MKKIKSLLVLVSLASFNCYALDAVTKPSKHAFEANKSLNVNITFYGSADNTPSGSGTIAHPSLHQKASGIGTYKNPVTFAAKEGDFPIGQIIYYPALQKYFIMEDHCPVCSITHIDLWAGYGTGAGIIKCEGDLKSKKPVRIIVSPSDNYPVDTTPIWNESNKKCQLPKQ